MGGIDIWYCRQKIVVKKGNRNTTPARAPVPVVHSDPKKIRIWKHLGTRGAKLLTTSLNIASEQIIVKLGTHNRATET